MRDKRIFIASTLADLAEERKAIANVVSKSGYFPILMERVSPTSEMTQNYVESSIRSADIVILIIGSTLGTPITKDGISYLEYEYRYVEKLGKPFVIFMLSDDKVHEGLSKAKYEQRDKILKFRDELQSKHKVKYFADARELAEIPTVEFDRIINIAGMFYIESGTIILEIHAGKEALTTTSSRSTPQTMGMFSDFLRLFTVVYEISKEEDIDYNHRKSLIRCISLLLDYSNIPRWQTYVDDPNRPQNIKELIDVHYYYFSHLSTEDSIGPSIDLLSYNSPLKITLSGSIKALTVAVIICGGEIDLSEGKAKIPGLVSAVSELSKVYLEHANSEHKKRQLEERFIESLPHNKQMHPTQ